MLIVLGLAATLVGYLLFLPIGVHSAYAAALLPTFLLGGIGFGLAYGPLNIAATNGIVAEEQGLAGGLLNTSFQFGGALVLAVVTAVNNAGVGHSAHPGAHALLRGFHHAAVVSLVAAALGVGASLARRWRTSPMSCIEVDVAEVLPEPVVEVAD
ncbi:MAG: hypothetical protein JO337_05090 [Acidimicrobiales bacterium]|nr:hypothetical protein [Acidimicrobiales bacterium]